MNHEKLAEQLTIDEGDIPHAYQDSLGYWTIGIGRLIDKRLGGGLSPKERQLLLKNDINRVAHELDVSMPWWTGMNDARQNALVNMCFNLGLPKLLGFRNTLTAMKEGRYDDAADGMLNSLWARQVGDRAKRLATMMRTGEFL